MTGNKRSRRIIRWLLSALLVLVGLSATWAWGEVARLAEPDPQATEPGQTPLYGIWQPEQAHQPGLYRSTDGGQSWESLSLPPGSVPLTWSQPTVPAEAEYLAVATSSGALISTDGGESWVTTSPRLEVLSLAWGADGSLYLGTDGQGVYRLPAGTNNAIRISTGQAELTSAAVTQLAAVPGSSPGEGRLYAAVANDLFYTDDGGQIWQGTAPVEDWISALAIVEGGEIYVGTETAGIYRSLDAGLSWQPAREGLGLAAGQMVKITALRADPQLPGVLYAAIDHVLGSTQTHASAAGAFISLNGGTSWQPLAGPVFPQAQHASSLVVLPEQPLHVDAVTANGRQTYAPDVAGALAALESSEPAARAAAARLLGLARASEAGEALLAALDDPEPAVSLAAGQALGQLADPSTAGPLLVALEHPTLQVRLGAARALGMMGAEAAVEPLRAMLLEGEGQEVAVAAQALGQIGSPAAVDALLVPLSDLTLTGRRHAALGALEALGEPAVEPLVQRLDSPSGHIRRNAAEALGWIAAPSASEALLQAVQQDGDPEVRAQAAWALGQIDDPAAQATLARVAADDPAVRVRSAAEQALAGLSEQTADQQSSLAGWLTGLAPALSRLQPLRWLFLAVSLVAAGWLAAAKDRLMPLAVLQRRTDS
jgi:HEAT repeat protein